MAISKNAVAGGITALGGTGAVAGVVIANQNKGTTIKEELSNYLIEIENESGFSNRWAQKGSETVPEGVGEGTNQKKLKDWCKEQYVVVITDEVRKENGLLSQVKKWCTFTIKQKLENEVLSVEATSGSTQNPDKSDWEIRTKNLKDYRESEEERVLNLNEISDTDTWEKLKDWCEKTYKLNHLENTSNKLEIAKKFCTKATILDALHGTELPTDSALDSVWTERVNAAKASSNGMKDTTRKAKLNEAGNNNTKKDLQEWCQKQYSKRHNAEEKFGENQTKENVLSEVKKWCTVQIKDKLDGNKKFSEFGSNDDSRWGVNEGKLTSHNDESPKLTKKLVSIKGTGTTDTNRKTKLKDWCKEAYEKGFKGNNDNLFLLVSKFCMKQD